MKQLRQASPEAAGAQLFDGADIGQLGVSAGVDVIRLAF
jgi:hypothetical protein